MYIVDNLQRSLHPMAVDYIIQLFSEVESNPDGSQLLFTSNDAYLPNRNPALAPDKKWFTSRDP